MGECMVTVEKNKTHQIIIQGIIDGKTQIGSKTLPVHDCKLSVDDIKKRLKKVIEKDKILDNGS